MKKILTLLIVVVAFVFTAMAQKDGRPPMPTRMADPSEVLFSTEGLSPSSAFLMCDLMFGKMSDKEIKEKYHFVEVKGEVEISAFVRMGNEELMPELDNYGVRINHQYGHLLTVQIPLNKFIALVQSKLCKMIDVGNVATSYLDNARASTGLDYVYNNFNLGQRFDGTGVVVGIIDRGFEYGHPTFFDSTGTTLRIKRVWDQNADTINPPSSFGYGTEFDNPDDILAAQHSIDYIPETHGTHVAGIAAGCGGNDAAGKTYRGAAPNADIVLVATTGREPDILKGIEYVKAYATSVNKPCVINLSGGSYLGSHDGTSPFCEASDVLINSSPNILFVVAAGNAGNDRIHLEKSFSSTDNEDNELYTFLDSVGSSKFYSPKTIDIWGSPHRSFNVRLLVYDAINNTFEMGTPIYSSQDTGTATFSIPDADGETILTSIYRSGETEMGKQNVQIKVNSLGRPTSCGRIVIFISCSEENNIHAWTDGKIFFTNGNQDWATNGNTDYTTSDNATGFSTIAVGSYVTRRLNNENPLIGGLSGFSSHGPTVDGRTKPDITAPGEEIISSLNKYDTDYTQSHVLVSTNNNTEFYGDMPGTSMSAPFVAGVLALCLQKNPNLTYSQAIDLLRFNAKTDNHTGDIDPSIGSNRWGWGKVNAKGMINELCIANIPYTENFEGDTRCWMIDGTGNTNQWVIGSTTNHTSGGSKALYISNDGGTTDGYTTSSASSVTAYRLLSLEAGDYIVSFDWKANGESDHDFLRAALLPASTDPSFMSIYSLWDPNLLPPSYIAVDGGNQLMGNLVWTRQVARITIPTAGEYNLFFYWHNNDNGGNTPGAAIDNIRIDIAPLADTISACGSYTWHETTYTESGDYTYSYTDGNGNPQIERLHLIINNPVHTAISATVSRRYIWHGVDHFFTGDYIYRHDDENGCLQVDTLHLTVNNPYDNVVEYWFDQDYDNRSYVVAGSATSWQSLLDVSSLNVGVHTLNMHLRDSEGHCSPPRIVMFYKAFEVGEDGNIGMDYTCWFDQDYANRHSGPFHNGTLRLDVNGLSDGLHTLNILIGSGSAAELHHYLFYKVSYGNATDFSMDYTCWFDQNFASRQVSTFTNGITLMDVSQLPDGLHTLNILIGSGAAAEVHSYLFYKASYGESSAIEIDYTCWFDQNYASRQTIASTNGSTLVEVSQLSDGLHTLNILIGSGASAEVHSYLFYKVSYSGPTGLSMDYTYWFDQNHASQQNGALTNGITLMDVSQLQDGLHTLNIQIGSGAAAELRNYLFYKASYGSDAGFSMDYTCWFDQNYDNHQSGSLSNGTMIFDVGDLSDGLHTLNMLIGSGAAAELHSYVFYCIPRQASLADTATLVYSYAIDGQQRPTLTVSPQNRLIHLELDVANLNVGLHLLTGCLVTSDMASMVQHSAYFYKQPSGGDGIIRYEYWYNEEVDNRMVVDLDPIVDTLQIITLLQVDTLPINSLNFEFDPNNGDPLIYYTDSITFRFWNKSLRISSITRQFVNERMVSTMSPDTIERNIVKNIVAPGAHQIHWFKFPAVIGESLSFRTDRRCAMQLYAPSGTMVMHASANGVLSWNTYSVNECGLYYLAVHDAEGDGNMTVSYQNTVDPGTLTTVEACGSYTWRGTTFTESGRYTFIVPNDEDCDSVFTLVLTVKPLPNVTISGNGDICQGSSTTLTASGANTYFWSTNSTNTSITVNEEGYFTVTGRGANGCSNTAAKTVSVHPIYNVELTDSICHGGGYQFHDQYLTAAGTYTHTLQTVNGCDSVVTLTLTMREHNSNAITIDTAVCTTDMPFVWYDHTVTGAGVYTTMLQNAVGCDSVVTLAVNTLLSDDFNDGVIDPAKWTYTGNAVLEEEGLLKLHQNVTDQDVHLRSIDMSVPNSRKVNMVRRFMVHRSNNYYYGDALFYFNGNTNNYIRIDYDYTTYEQWYGTYILYRIDGQDGRIRICDARFDTWITERVELDFAEGTLSYYLDTLIATVNIPGFATQAVDYYNVQFNPWGWWTGHQHYMDWLYIYGDSRSVSTTAARDITYSSATCGGYVVSDNCTAYTVSGICWSTNPNPSLDDAYTTDGSGVGAFTSLLTDLYPGTTYYIRAYATNSTDTAYGQEMSFTTLGECPVRVVVTSDNASHGTCTGSGCYAIGDTAVLYALAQPNFIFRRWSDNDTTNPRYLITESDTTLTAIFDLYYPELHVTSLSHSDFIGGEPVTISWTVQNDGMAPTPNGEVWYDRVWLSLENRVAAGDNNPILLGEFPNVSALGPGEYYTQTQTFDIPLSLQGSYFLFVISDAYDAHFIYWDGEVPMPYNPPAYIGALSSHCSGRDCGNYAGNKIIELSELDEYPAYHDNFFYELVDITIPPLPDLKVSDIAPIVQNFFSGTDVDIAYQVLNDGNYDTRVSNWTDMVFVSNSSVFDENAQLIKTIPHYGLLMPDSTYEVSTTVTVPIVMMGTAWFYVYTDYYDQVYEHVGRYNNVTRSDSVNIRLNPPADLAPQNITSDHTVSTGATFNFSYEIHNQGAGEPNNSQWLDRCYLSTSAFALENDILMAEDWHYSSLEHGDYYAISHTVTLPSNITGGTYYLFVQTDVQNNVFEYDMEENNLLCMGQPIVVVMPDLQIRILNSEDTLHAAAEEGISYYVANMDEGAIVNRTVVDRVYLSPNSDGTSATQIAETSHNLWLNPYDSIRKLRNVTIPENLQDGNYYLFVSTNVHHSLNESDLTNNQSPIKQVYIHHLPLPDLVISSIEMPNTVTAGDTAVMSVLLQNQGDADVNVRNLSWQLGLAVGTRNYTCVIGVENADIETLSAGSTTTLQINVLIPPITTLDSGLFELTVNQNHGVTEANYSNNAYGFTRTIQPYLFDLAVTQFSLPAATVSGNNVTVSWTVENMGSAPSESWPMYVRNGSSYQQAQGNQLPSPWFDRVYLSVDSLFDDADLEMGSYAYSYVLNAGSTYTASMNCEIPLSASGDYYVLIVSDATGITYDGDRTNNVQAQALVVTASALPDLRMETMQASDTLVTLDTYQIYYTVSNRGEHVTHSDQWTDAIYLNNQPTLQGAQQLGTKIHEGLLNVNAQYMDEIQVTIPHIPAGDYYLIGYTNAMGQVVEMDGGTNNLFILPISVISCALPDLQIDTLVVSTAVTTGESYQINYTVSNRGEYVTRSNRWTDAFYLNSEPTLQGTRHIGSKIHNGQLDINAHYTDAIQVVIPNVSAGDYYLIAYTDATEQVMEMDNESNVYILPLSVVRPLPCDLTVLPPEIPSSANIGEEIQVSWNLQNVGYNMAQGNIKEAVYLSTDSVWSSDDIMLGSMTYFVNLTANSQTQRNATLTLQGVPAGDYYVVVRTNILNALNENSYTNNKAVSLMTLHVDYPSLYIDQEEHRQLNSGQTAYYKLEVGPEYEHQTLSCKLTSPIPNVSNGLYIAYSAAPSASNFDFSATVPYVQEQEILIPSLNQGTYYIMVTGQTSDNTSQNVTILASIINFEILSIDANSGSNAGSVTTQIIGAKFDTIMDFRLANSNGYLPAEKVFFNNSTESFVTFNLRDQETGVYDVVAELPGGIITIKEQSFVIEEGLPAELLSNIIAPASVRKGNTFTVTIEYGNNGSTDLNVSGLLLVCTSGFPIAFTTEGLAHNAYGLIFETAEPNGNPDVIRPGYFATKTIFVRATHTGSIKLQLFPIRRQY